MTDFDSMWDLNDINVDLSGFNPNTSVNKKFNKPTVNIEKNTHSDLDNIEVKDKASQWRTIIATLENRVTKTYKQEKEVWDYKKDKLMPKYKAVKGTNTPEEKSLAAQLRALKLNYLELKSDEEDNVNEINFLKGRASGFINQDNYLQFNDNPEKVKKELETGKYPYKPTPESFR